MTDILQDQKLIDKALQYIDKQWVKLERSNTEDDKTLIGLPRPYIVPSEGSYDKSFVFQEMYYWDSYFIALGLFDTENEHLAVDMLENLLYMFDKFGIIPNCNRFYSTSRSQPPFLTSFIFELYDRIHDKNLLAEQITKAKQEYEFVWLSKTHPNWRNVYQGLSRYYQIDALHDLSEAESGWDMNPRFYRRCLDFLPVDLNSLLYKYETDFYKAAIILDDLTEAKHWVQKAKHRRDTMNKLMWNEHEGFFFDFNYILERPGHIWSLAPYYTMWARMASEEQADRLVRNLEKFEYVGGLSTCPPHQDIKREIVPPMQWDYPNGWAPLQWMVIKGLQNYGYFHEAERIAKKWLANNLTYFKHHGVFIEKYNVVNPEKEPKDGVYPTQIGFGWTDAVFVLLHKEFVTHNLTGVRSSLPVPLYA